MKTAPCRILLAALIVAGSLHADTETDHALDDAFQADLAALLPNEPPPAPAPQLMSTSSTGETPMIMAAPSTASQQGAWGPVISWTPHVPVTAAVLPDGRLLTFASNRRNAFPSGPEFTYAAVWNPATGAFTEINNDRHDMFCGGTAMLPDGRVLINGGRTCNRWSSIFDWRTNQWIAAQNMNDGRWYNTSVVLPDGRVFTISGTNGERTAERWAASTGWARLSGIDWQPILNESGFDQRWHPHLMLAPDGRLFHSGPTDKMHWVNLSGSGSFTTAGPVVPGSHFPKEGAWAMYDEGKILVAGGFGSTNGGSATRLAYTVNLNGSSPVVASAAQMTHPRTFANSVILPNGEMMVVGGNTTGAKFNDTGAVYDTEIWNPATGQWRIAAPISIPRTYHSLALLLTDGTVWSGGGGLAGNAQVDHPDAQVYLPASLFNADGSPAERPEITAAPDRIGPGVKFTVQATPGVTRFTFIRLNAQTHSVSTDLRFLELPSSEVAAGKYEVTARSNLNVMVPGYWMLFALNANGTHSVSKVIQVTADNAPTVTNPGPQTSEVGSVVSLQIHAASTGNGTLSFSATGLPAGLSIHAGSGVISGSPASAGTSEVTVTVTQSGAPATVVSFPWSVSQEFTVSLPGNTPKPAGSPVTLTASATGGQNPRFTWSFGDGTPDSPLSSSPNVAHTFAAPGRYVVTVTVVDDSGRIRTASFRQAVHAPLTTRKPAASSPIAYEARLSANSRVWVANPDNDTVTVFDAVTRAKLAEIAVAAGPRSLAFAPDGRVWVACARAGKISMINPDTLAVNLTVLLHPGSAPFGLVFSPDGSAAWVACEGSGDVLRMNPFTGDQVASIPVGANVRHLSISADGSRVLASRFVTPRLPGEDTGVPQTTVNGQKRGGEVLVVNTATHAVASTIILEHSDLPDTSTSARGIPNYLGAAAISPDGLSAWVPSKQDNIMRGAFRDGLGLTHDQTVRAIVSRINLTNLSATASQRLDFDDAGMPSAAVFDPYGMYLFVALEASREVAVIDAWSRMEFARFDVGRAPQGLALSDDGATLYVHNFMDRSVTVHDVSSILRGGQLPPQTAATLRAIATERLSPQVLLGKQHFYDARDPRIALQSYISCASCHQDGDTDGRVWDLTGFGEGLRNTISLRGHGGTAHGPLHWSANFDEVQDFENQIRSLNAGTGLMSNADFSATQVTLGAPKAGRSADLDALAAYVASLSDVPPSPHRNANGSLTADAVLGQQIFQSLNCAECHGGTSFSDSAPDNLHDIGTLRPGSGQRLGGALAGIDTPTLRGVWATAPYLHNGAAATLGDAVLAHGGVSLTPTELGRLTAYLQQIDASPVTAPRPFTVALNTASANVSGSFSVAVNFSDAAAGLATSDFAVTNGAATALSGSGANYAVTIAPASAGEVTVALPANAAIDPNGAGNRASNVVSVSYDPGSGSAPELADDFNDNSRDPAKWNIGAVFGTIYAGPAGFDAGIIVAERNGRLEVAPRTNATGDRYAGYVSASSFDLHGAAATVRVVQTAAGDADTIFCVSKDPQNFLLMVVESGGLYIDHAVNGARNFTAHAYAPAQDRYWRIRHDGGTPGLLTFETSADGNAWRVLRTDQPRFALTATRVELGSGTWKAEAAPGMAIFDDFAITRTAPAPTNQPPIARPGGPYSGTAGAAVAMSGSASSDPDGTIANYVWDFGDGSTGAGATPSRIYAAPGTYTVTLTVTDNSGASHSATTTATIASPANQAPIARPGGPYSGVAGTAVAMDGSASSDPDGAIASYAWNFGDNTTGAGATPSHIFAASGTYTVTLTVTDNAGATHSATTTATIAPAPNQAPIARPGGPYSGTAGIAVAMSGSASSDPDGTIASYAWNFGDNSSGAGATPSHIYASPGAYTVTLTVTDNSGATHSATTTATIAAAGNQLPVARPGGPYSAALGQPVMLDGTASEDPDGSIVSYEWRLGDTAKLSNVFADEFTDNTRDAAKWSVGAVFGTIYAGSAGYDPGITLAERNSRLEVVLRPNQSGDRYAGYVSAASNDFTGGAASVEVVQAAAGGSDTLLCVSKDSQNFALMVAEAGGLYCIQGINGGFSVAGVGYNPAQHRYWRIRHAAPAIVFEASGNGSTWAVLHSEDARFAVTATRVEIGAGTYQPEAAPGMAVFDNFKLTRLSEGPETVAAGATVTHTYTAPGTYLVRLKVTDSSGGTNQAETSVVIGSAGSAPGSLALDASSFFGPGEGEDPAPRHDEAFAKLRGSWIAVSAGPVPAKLGIVVSSAGVFTGQLRLGASVVPVRGRLSLDGTAAVIIRRKHPETLSLQFALDSERGQLRGAIHRESILAELAGYQALFSASANAAAPRRPVPPEWLGRWSLELAAASAEGRAGYGVARTGSARVAGRLGNGRPFAAAAPLAADGRWPLYSVLPGGRELFAGWMQISSDGESADGEGRRFRAGAPDERLELRSANPAR